MGNTTISSDEYVAPSEGNTRSNDASSKNHKSTCQNIVDWEESNRKCDCRLNEYDLYQEKILASKGKLKSPQGLEWFPKGHGHKHVTKLFELKQELGRGMTCTVFSAIYKGNKCAIKRIKRQSEWSMVFVTTEGRILRNLKNNGVINLVDMYFDNDYYYFVMERAYYDLFTWINANDWVNDKLCSRIVRNLFKGLKYLHSKNIVHRDLKPENIVFCKGDKYQSKLIDFGDSMYIKDDKTYDEYVGTPQYMSKERYVLHKGWELKKSDVFALGVISYEMVTRQRCFNGLSRQEIYEQVSNGEWQWPINKEISQECKDFVQWCLQIDAKNRPSCEEALLHPWLTQSSYRKSHNHLNLKSHLNTNIDNQKDSNNNNNNNIDNIDNIDNTDNIDKMEISKVRDCKNSRRESTSTQSIESSDSNDSNDSESNDSNESNETKTSTLSCSILSDDSITRNILIDNK